MARCLVVSGINTTKLAVASDAQRQELGCLACYNTSFWKPDGLKTCSAGAATNTNVPSHSKTVYAAVIEHNKKSQQARIWQVHWSRPISRHTLQLTVREDNQMGGCLGASRSKAVLLWICENSKMGVFPCLGKKCSHLLYQPKKRTQMSSHSSEHIALREKSKGHQAWKPAAKSYHCVWLKAHQDMLNRWLLQEHFFHPELHLAPLPPAPSRVSQSLCCYKSIAFPTNWHSQQQATGLKHMCT